MQIYQYRRSFKNLFTGAIEYEYLKCEVLETVSNISVKIKILVTGKESIVRKKNIIGFSSGSTMQASENVRLPYKD